jgi:uroporphyrinogen-III synthase
MGVAAFIRAVEAAGRHDDVVAALREHTIAACVGAVTAAAFDTWDVPTLAPDRARTAAMVTALEAALRPRD